MRRALLITIIIIPVQISLAHNSASFPDLLTEFFAPPYSRDWTMRPLVVLTPLVMKSVTIDSAIDASGCAFHGLA